MSKHTPGPWYIEHAEDIDLPNHVGISAKGHGLLAQVVWKMEDDERTPGCEANARLIAAAPLMLEALKDACDCIDHWAGYASDYFRKKHNIDADLARIEAAIAAAEGDKK